MAGQTIHLPSLLWASNTETHPNAARFAFDSQSCAPPSLRRFQHTTSPTSSSSRSQQVLRTGVAFSVPLKGDELPAFLRARNSEGDMIEALHKKATAGQADNQRPRHTRHHFYQHAAANITTLLVLVLVCSCVCACALRAQGVAAQATSRP